ncbi:sugar phosphate isomerase/epimerase family protein [Methanosphaera sp.]|uniref:sugar phosphate isomerase/epimerase family protein n=1 Tax=Methanosphaera sp. TaxID=2666342 RepID=UPI002E76F0D3|nr:sugar phosphate isomerase/epimerase family protein [Methanosphaera sp.]MEE1117827.1 sugar phosphate isomerase/epimerase family protein [Methanosphaera sp.]
MNIGFSTLSVFMKSNSEIISLAKKHEFDMIEILAEDIFYEKDNEEFKNCGLDVRIHAATVDINIASINRGIRVESVKQMLQCAKYAEKIGAKTITVHPGKIGRNDSRLRKYALNLAIESIGEIMDQSNVEISIENMPVRKSFLANNVDELEMIQNETGCKLTIDTGHANTCNNLVEMLNLKNISYCHLNDNDGLHDQHITLGEGTLDLNLLKKIDNGVIELNNFENVLKSKTVINNL